MIAGTVQIDGGAVQALPGSPWSAGESININLTSFLPGDGALNGHWVLLHLFDTATGDPEAPPANHLGRITLAGSIGVEDPFNPGQVQLLVSSALETEFPTFAEFPIGPGATDWAGLECTSPDLQRRSLIAASLLGDLTDDLAVGRIHRIESFAVAEGGVYQRGGRIMGDIVSNAPNDTLYPIGTAIRSVVAHREISGDLVATLPVSMLGDPYTRASIGAIRLRGPFASSLSGDISAVHGAIGTIWSAAPVGRTSGPTLKIWAGHGIRQVVAFDEASNQEVDADIDAIIYAYQVGPNGEKSYEANPQRGPAYDAPIELIATKGSITGEIRAANIHASGLLPAVPLVERRGIYCDPDCINGAKVGGDLLAPVTIDYVCEGTIAARSIQAPVIVGRMLEGAIVAWDVDAEQVPPQTNRIPLISIGEAPDIENPFYSRYEPGFTGFGIGSVCWTPNFRECEEIGLIFQGDCEEGTAASIIAAHRVDQLSIARVSVWEHSEGYSHAYPPLIEVASIGELTIGQLREGIVWSGIVVPESPTQAEHLGDRYASIEHISLGCVGPMGDIWAMGFDRMDVTKNFLGELHAPSLIAGSLIQIGGGLVAPGSDPINDCNCGAIADVPCAGAPTDWEPVHPLGDLRAELMAPRTPGTDRPPVGAIRLKEPFSLGGQVSIHADSLSQQHDLSQWTGDVIIGDGAVPAQRIVLSADSTRASYPLGNNADAIAPLYNIPSHILGGQTPPARGGAIGLVPFARYEADCNPLNAYGLPLGQADYIFDLPLQDPDHEYPEVAFYGPIAINGDRGVDLLRVDPHNFENTVALGASIWDDVVPANLPRVLRLTPGSLGDIPPGRNRVEPLPTLVCDLGPDYPATIETFGGAPLAPHFDFVLGHECIPVAPAESCLCLHTWCFLADFDFSGSLDGDDVILFFAAWDESDDLADLDLQNGVDGDDVILFFCWWDEGCSF